MTELAAYLAQFDAAWNHAYESYQSVTKGVTQAQAFEQPAAYAKESKDDGWPAPGSIAWQVAHLVDCKHHYTHCLEQVLAGEEKLPKPEMWDPTDQFSEILEAAETIHARQRAAMENLQPEHLDVIAGNQMTTREFLSMFIRHDTWHAAQIAVARRLIA